MLAPTLVCALGALLSSSGTGEWSCPAIPEVIDRPYPRIAATATELERLRSAYADEKSPGRSVVAERIREADKALKESVEFPPRGGQHNQWYQCDDCQIALRTLDATHHRCPECGKVYSGEPYDDVLYSRRHSANLRAALATAWAYAVTGEQRYADFTARILLGYAARYREYPYHSASRSSGGWNARSGGHLFEQTLTEASALASYIAPAYDLISAGDRLTEAQHEQIRQGLLIPMLENIGKYRAGKSNWQTWHNAAMLAGGAVIGDGAWVRRAVTDAGNGFVDQMQISVSDDGMWYENSWGYHFYTLRAMIQIVEGSRRLGIDPYYKRPRSLTFSQSQRPTGANQCRPSGSSPLVGGPAALWNHPRLKSMFTVAIDYAMPNGRLPRFGDDVNTSMGSVASSLEFAYHAYGSESMQSYLPTRATWDSLMLGRRLGDPIPRSDLGSRVFTSAGHAILRTGGPDGLVSVTTFGPYGGFHGHYDKLSFVFYARGRELGVDPGRAASQAYRLPIHRNWYKATISHNTVMVDGKSQSPASGQLLWFDDRPDRPGLAVRCDEAFPGVAHTRVLLQTADYLLVLDDLKSDVEHRYDWLYHNRGQWAACNVDVSPLTSTEASSAGMEYVENARQGSTDQAVRIAASVGGVQNWMVMNAAAKTTVLLGEGVGSSVRDRVPMMCVSRTGTHQRFATVFEPQAADATPTVTNVACHPQGSAIRLEVMRGTDVDRYLIAADWRVTEVE